MFKVADKAEEKLFLQNNCPGQNSDFAKAAMEKSHCSVSSLVQVFSVSKSFRKF